MKNFIKIVGFVVFVGVIAFVGSQGASYSLAAEDKTINLQFVNHLQAGFPEQDVFVERGTPAALWRVEPSELANELKAEKVYATLTATAHDPFKLGTTPLGPFVKGKALGFTLGSWLDANGTGTYMVAGTQADMKLSFQKLVPKGVYTVWCSRLTVPPNVKVVDKPCGAADGSQNKFAADGQGMATFNLKLAALPESSAETLTLIALAYHSDGKTYGATPGAFGMNSHVQLFAILPPPATPVPSTIASIVPSVSASPAPASGRSSGLLWIIIIIVVIVVLGLWSMMKKPSNP